MSKLTRRRFLQSSIAGAAVLALPAYSWARVAGANSEIAVAVVGLRNRGRALINAFHSLEGVRVVALCDVDRDILAREQARFTERDEQVKTYRDYRRLLEDREVDVIVAATPNHWHALNTIWACQAGKDVYVEKPISHTIHEGRVAVETARRHGRIVQTGTQGRSSECILEAVDFLKNEHPIGEIRLARGICYRPREAIGRVDRPQPAPDSVDYDLWLGPAPEAPVKRANFHYDWHWFWDYGNGDIGNTGPHQMDLARWIIGQQEFAPAVFSVGGRLGYGDDGETFNTHFSFYDYSPVPILFEVRNLQGPEEERSFRGLPGSGVSAIIEGEGGYLVIPSTYRSANFYDRDGQLVREFASPRGNHAANFIEAVRTRREQDLKSGLLDGHLSAGLCHMGNISARLGHEAQPEEVREALAGDRELSGCFERTQEHLAANEVDLEKEKLRLGVALKMDPRRERFRNNDQANRLVVGSHRAPFDLPSSERPVRRPSRPSAFPKGGPA